MVNFIICKCVNLVVIRHAMTYLCLNIGFYNFYLIFKFYNQNYKLFYEFFIFWYYSCSLNLNEK